MRAAGGFIYLSSDSSNKDFQVYNADPSTGLALVSNSNNSNKGAGVDYEDQFIYLIFNQGSKTLQVYYAP